MKKTIDIEKLVQWALRDEVPKGRPTSMGIGQILASLDGRRSSTFASRIAPCAARHNIDSLGYNPWGATSGRGAHRQNRSLS